MQRLSWIIQVGNKCIYRGLRRGKQEGQSQRTVREGRCDNGSRGPSDVKKGTCIKNCGPPLDTGKGRKRFSPRTSHPADTLILTQ